MFKYFQIFISVPHPETEGDRLRFELKTENWITDETLVDEVAVYVLGMFRKESQAEVEIEENEVMAELPPKFEETLGMPTSGWSFILDKSGKLIKLTKEDDEESEPH